jgi:Tfp pilus assembly protein PilF
MDVHTVPNSARVHVNLGVEYMQRNQLDAALAEFDRGLQIYPTFPSALENHALLDSRLRRDLEALRMFRQALSVVSADNVDYNFMRVNLAAQLTKMAQYDEALDLLNQTIAQTPDYSRAWSNRAVIRLRRGDFKSARADAQTALRLDSTNAQAESPCHPTNAVCGGTGNSGPGPRM